MYEQSKQPVISRRLFITRIMLHTFLALFLILFGLGIVFPISPSENLPCSDTFDKSIH